MTHVVVVGASGNVGSSVVEQLRAAGVERITGVVRRPPSDSASEASWRSCDIGDAAAAAVLRETFEGADAVVHLAWQIQPGRDLTRLHRTNVTGSQQVIDAVVAAGVPALAYASSIGA